MTDRLENPQAFPHGNPTHGGDIGMSLRDYFAGQALASIVGSSEFNAATCSQLAEISYRCAAAMLKERMGDLVPSGEDCGDPDHEGWYHGEWGLLESDLRPTLWTLPPPPGEEVESDEVVFDDGFNPFMDGYDVDPDGPQNQVPPFRASDIERGLILLRTSSNAHGYTNCVILTDRIEKLPAKGRQELARMMRNIATEIDGPSPLQARCDKLEAAAREADRKAEAGICQYTATGKHEFLKDVRKALRSVVDEGE